MTPDEKIAANDELQRAYRICFGSPAGQAVLADLAPFTNAAETCFRADARAQALEEGKRLVWLRIQQFMNLTQEDILQLALRRPRVKPGETTDG